MAIKFFTVTFVLACAVLLPINQVFTKKPHKGEKEGQAYLWTYTVFTYLFSALAFYFILDETKRVIRVRQDLLGSQSTITDRTILLNGIPEELRTEEKIAEIVEKLEIGKVESVTLCRDWKMLDDLMDRRRHTLRQLEEAWTVYLGQQRKKETLPVSQLPPGPSNVESDDNHPREDDDLIQTVNYSPSVDKLRPTTRIAYGIFNFRRKKVDAINYYEEHLRRLDEKIIAARQKEYQPTPMAFVTMDSVAACQMAVQAVIDPSPMKLLASPAPSPSDVIWTNTYTPRSRRIFLSWTITIFVLVLSIVWLIPVAALASLLSVCTIEKYAPNFAKYMAKPEHEVIASLLTTTVPTVVVSLLNVGVPILYDNLSNMQGFISRSEVELSLISKNFFFSFFNIFLVFTAFGTVSKILPVLQDSLKDSTKLAHQLANSLHDLAGFYTNFILLQGVGLFPMRLLEFGSVAMYPISRIGAKTPRDFGDLAQPPLFNFGYYLPTSILMFILCLVYSVLPDGYLVVLFGLMYFVIGYWVYKYQLLYAMDQPQHGTGRLWTMICYRLMIGLGIFQLAMFGFISLKSKYLDAVIVLPLIGLTIWFSRYYARTYAPLTKYISLRSIIRDGSRASSFRDEVSDDDHRPNALVRVDSTTLDEERERGQRYAHPSLIAP